MSLWFAPVALRSALPRRLFENPVTQPQFLAELQRQLDDVFDEAALHAEINRIEALILPVSGDLTAQLAPIRTFIDDHRALVQAEIDSPPPGFGGQPNHFCVLNP